MERLNDQAQQILRRIAQVWQVEDHRARWNTSSGQSMPGFEWWPGDFRVAAWVEVPSNPEGDAVLKVVVRTDFLRDVAIDSERFETMTAMMAGHATSTYAWIYPPRSVWQRHEPREESPSLWFNSSVYVTPDNIGWMPDLLATTALLQPINAQIQARAFAEILESGAPDMTRPAELQDAGLDDILEVVAQVYAPLGEQPSRWARTDEFEQFIETWGRSDDCFGFSDRNEMTLETPFGNDSARIMFLTAERHPQLGHGLLVTLQLPHAGDRLTMARTAAWLNSLEGISWTDFPQLGCWHARENRPGQGGVAFALFMPNALYRPVLATNIGIWFLRRARWAREQMFPHLQDVAMMDILQRRLGGMEKT